MNLLDCHFSFSSLFFPSLLFYISLILLKPTLALLDFCSSFDLADKTTARPGQPQEFAALVRHGIENVMLNGVVLRLDGGMRMPSKM